jgi:hypothetical protein
MRWRASIGIAVLALSHLVSANASSALAQAGSTGGTIGKQDKSISGEERPSEPYTHRRNREVAPKTRGNAALLGPGAPSCGNIVGTWDWPNGTMMVFGKDGNAGRTGQPPSGTWRCSGSRVIAVFNNGGRDQYVVAPDGNSLTFTTNWIPGTYTATRKN